VEKEDIKIKDKKTLATKPSAESIRAETIKAAVAADRQRLSQLKAAFSADAAFVIEQYEAGATVEQAKARYCDILLARETHKPAKKRRKI